MSKMWLGIGGLWLVSAGTALAVPPQCERAYRQFWTATTGKTVERLPVNLVPENSFVCFNNYDMGAPTDEPTVERVRRIAAKGSYNCFTLGLRCRPDLNDAISRERTKSFCEEAHRHGIQVLIDIDARVGRFEFLRRWPKEAAGVLRVETIAPTNGLAAFEIGFGSYRDHMSWDTRAAYEPLASELVGMYAVRVGADELAIPGSARELKPTEGVVSLPNMFGGEVRGLAADERLVVAVKFRLLAVDPCSPKLTPYLEELARDYKALGVDGAMRDEWGFPPMRDWTESTHRAYPYSARFAAEYAKATGGRDYIRDCMLITQGEKGREAGRSQAIDDMFREILRTMSRTEMEFYDMNRRVFGEDVYVTKHPTWHTGFQCSEFFHNGFDWWQAKRDFAQSDESVPLPCILGMARKFGGHVWMNEGYGPNPEHYGYAVWRYALCGGRMVYLGLFGNNSSVGKMSEAERYFHGALDILTPGNVAAQTRVRLLDLITRAQVEVPVAMVFGHSRVMNWLDPAFCDGGLKLAYRLGYDGWYAESFPSTELQPSTLNPQPSTLNLDSDGYLRVGTQRYAAVVLYRLSAADAASWQRIASKVALKTKVFAFDSPRIEGATELKAQDDVALIESALTAAGATRQTPLGKTGLYAWSNDRLPDPDGMVTLNDGTVARVKASKPDLQGDAIRGKLMVKGVEVEYAARGIFAIRLDAKGDLEGLAAGGLEYVKFPGFELKLDHPEDVALLKLEGKLRGTWQTSKPQTGLPKAFAELTDDWRILRLPKESCER